MKGRETNRKEKKSKEKKFRERICIQRRKRKKKRSQKMQVRTNQRKPTNSALGWGNTCKSGQWYNIIIARKEGTRGKGRGMMKLILNMEAGIWT